MKLFAKMQKLGGCAALALVVVSASAQAQVTFPPIANPGSDGALNVTANTVIDLSQAPTGAWDGVGTNKGIYDPAKWAVVFKYSSVTIAAGQTVSFTNHASRAPVVWLVNGDVTISGNVSLNSSGREPGPGGFRGAYPGINNTQIFNGAGFGPGGGSNTGGGGKYAASPYGNVQILPLIGGSGAGAYALGGGGAILIASTGTITLNGLITANSYSSPGSSGSGGAVRLVANSILGNGSLSALVNSDGRLRIEANTISNAITTLPSTIRVAPDNPVKIWPDANAPTIRVVSVDGVTVPTDPKSNLDAAGADTVITKTIPATIILETTNVVTTATVSVRITNKYGAPITATATLVPGGTLALSQWTATATIPQGFAAIQAIAKP